MPRIRVTIGIVPRWTRAFVAVTWYNAGLARQLSPDGFDGGQPDETKTGSHPHSHHRAPRAERRAGRRCLRTGPPAGFLARDSDWLERRIRVRIRRTGDLPLWRLLRKGW